MQNDSIEKGDVGVPGPSKVYMPWKELFEAFIADTPYRSKEAMKVGGISRLGELRERRVLTIGSLRQTGKAAACHDLLVNTPSAKFAIGDWLESYYMRRLGAERFKEGRVLLSEADSQIKPLRSYPFSKETFAGVKLLIVDSVSDECYASLECAYMFESDWFDPEFSVIRIS